MADKLSGKYDFVDGESIQTVTVDITNAEIKTMYSANTNKGKILLPAPGSTKIIECISAIFKLDYSGAALSHWASCSLKIGTNSIGSIQRTFLEAAEDFICYRTYDYDLVTLSTYLNQPLYLQANTLDPTGGSSTSTIRVKILYRILDFG